MRRRGFTVLELLVVIGLMSVIGLLSQRMFVSSVRAMQSARSAETAETRFDHAMLRLRADAWSANAISADGLSASLTEPNGATITWRFDPTGALTRSDGKGATTWPDISTRARFSARGPALVLALPEGFSKTSSEIELVSQLQLAGGGAP